MDATHALNETDGIISGLISNLTPEHREMRTPCDQWNVHELIEHMVGGAHGVAGGLLGETPPEESPDLMADGPASAWAGASAHMSQAATPEILTSLHQMPFGEVPGEAALGVIVSDLMTHAWDLAQATGQGFQPSSDLVGFVDGTWRGLAPAEGREEGGVFKPVIDLTDGASQLDQMLAWTGRHP